MNSLRRDIFWNVIEPRDHFVQFYDDTDSMLGILESFIGGGIQHGDASIVIATRQHLSLLESRLLARGIDLAQLRADHQFQTFDATTTLAQFIVNGMPDEALFRQVIGGILKNAQTGGRRVRAFGEMVSILWANGLPEATIELERIWHRYNEEEEFTLYCAYPRSVFTSTNSSAFDAICASHSKVLELSE